MHPCGDGEGLFAAAEGAPAPADTPLPRPPTLARNRERIKGGNTSDLKAVLEVWTKSELWIPPRQDQVGGDAGALGRCPRGQGAAHPPAPPPAARPPPQAFQQGGVLLFQGPRLAWAHYDPATSAHADVGEVVRRATAA